MAASAASAPQAEAVLAPVQVQGVNTAARDTKTLGQLLKAESIFKDGHAQAPQATLKFKVFGRIDAEQWQAVDLGLLTPQGRISVLLDEQGRFGLDDSWRALDKDTELRSRLMDGKVTWRPDVRTPGSSVHLRRLGDLRLQCSASFYSGVARSNLVSRLIVPLLKPLLNGCDSSQYGWSQFADAPLFGLSLRHGGRIQRLSQSWVAGITDFGGSSLDWGHALRDRLYRLPLGDKQWPDDTEVVIDLVSDAQPDIDAGLLQGPGALAELARSLQPGQTRWEEVQARLDRAKGMHRYDSGLRMAFYADTRTAQELVLLFDAEDRLVKFDLRAMGLRPMGQTASAPWQGRPSTP